MMKMRITEARQTATPPAKVLNRKPDANSLLASTPRAATAAQASLLPVQARFGHDFSRLALTADSAASFQRQTAESPRGQEALAPRLMQQNVAPFAQQQNRQEHEAHQGKQEIASPVQCKSADRAAMPWRTSSAPIQRGKMTRKIAKERARKTWKKTRKWPQKQLQGRILERADKIYFRSRNQGCIDMNKVKANFPAVDNIANGTFRQVKAFLAIPSGNSKAARASARQAAVGRILQQALDLGDKCETAARQLTGNNGRLLKVMLDIHRGRRSTKGRTGVAPYDEVSKTKLARSRHKNVLPASFVTVADKELRAFKKDADHDWDTDSLAMEISSNMVIVVPDELVADMKKELKSNKLNFGVEGGGYTSEQIQAKMDKIGYAPSTRKTDDEMDGDFTG